MTNMMKALVKAKPEPGLWMETRPVPEIGPDDVLIRIHKTGICGTDIHIWNWDDWAQRTVPVPLVTGHEFAGEIVEIGRNVEGLTIGQRCSRRGPPDRQDLAARAGRASSTSTPRRAASASTNPAPSRNTCACPPSTSCPCPTPSTTRSARSSTRLGNAVHTALSFDLVGEDVLITGAGPIGIMAAAVARHVGARHVVITDINPARLDLAAQVADVVPVNVATEDLRSVMPRLKMAQGFDVGMEMSGSQAALDQMVERMVMGGRIAMLGIPPGKSPVDWSRIVFKAITIKGVYGREIFETWYKMIAMLENGLDVRRVITHRFKVDEFREGFEAMRVGLSGKVVLDWG